MTFDVAAEAYGRFMGRYSEQLAEPFLDFVGARDGHRALDVGCGPGALTARLAGRLGADAVAAVDPSAPFLAAVRERLPGVDIRQASAEQLPFDDDAFDLALAQLVVHFMADPAAGLAEMRRVTRPGGTAAASVWDHGGGRGPLSPFWAGVHSLSTHARDESALAGSQAGDLAALLESTGFREIEDDELTVSVRYSSFEEWWEPFTFGVGPAGDYVAGLAPQKRETLQDRLADRMGSPPFVVTATAWCVRGGA
jgi:ubiquinone/menaquinone biosynthesis C-methylase UbiE